MRKFGWISSLCIKLALFLLPVATHSQTWGPKYVSVTNNSGGFYEYLPVGYNDPANSTRKYPVILAIHGVGELGNGTTDLYTIANLGIPGYIQQNNFPSSFTVNGVSYSFIIIAPQFKQWPTPADVQGFLNYVENNYRADGSRLYLTGLSMGGGVAWDYAGSSASAANRIAALLPVCGASSPNGPAESYMASANLPVLATHNDGDPTVTVSNTIGYVDGINSFGPNPSAKKVIFSSGAHNAWTRTYDPNQTLIGGLNAYQWLLQYSRGSGPVAPAPVAVSIGSVSQVTCAAAYNGSATATASGGAGSYSYSWNTNPVQTTAKATNLGPGTYTVTAKDANGSTATASVTITEPAPLVLSVVPGSISLFGGSTSVSLSATGGTAPYTFTGPTSNVVAGTYTYKVTDAKGCGDSKTITITQPAASAPTASISSATNVSCNGANNGSATVSVSGGLAPFTYSWNTSPVQTGSTATNLAAGNYTVTVKDANGNSATANTVITQPAPLAITVTPGTITTNGGSTTVTLAATGGTPAYTYSGPTSNVKAGTYTYTVTDAKGCGDSKTITITEPAAPAPTPPSASIGSSTNVSCAGSSNGSATVSVTGGLAPYTYSWNTSPVQTGATASNLAAGNYTVTVKDANGNSATANAVITQPSPLVISVTPGTISTNGGNTTVSLSATGGTAAYTFSGGPTTNVTAGTYTYKVTDAKGCTDSKTITITEPAAPAPAPAPPSALAGSITAKTNVTCNGSANGSATVSVSGGTAPYTYSWNSSPVQTAATASNLGAGNYSVTVKDAGGQTVSVAVSISEPAKLVLSTSAGTIATYGGTTTVSLSATGGTAPYVYSGAATTNVLAGTYTYTVTDANGCTDSKTISITEPSAPAPPQPAAPSTPLSVTVTGTDIGCNGASNGSATAVASGGAGSYSYSWNTQPVNTSSSLSGLGAGNYTVTVKDGNGASVTKSVTISEPAKLLISVKPGTITEYQGKTLVYLDASGGTAPYTYSGGPTEAVRAGTYTYTVTDAHGCEDSKTITLTEPAAPAPVAPTPALSVSATTTDIACNGANNGSATAVATGGVGTYTFSWNTSPVQTSASVTGLSAGTYTVTVKDANGTTANTTVTITEPTKLALTVTPGTITEYQGKTLVSLTAEGGSAPYTYSGGPTTAVVAGTYTYTVTDAKGCTDSKTVTITEPGAPAPAPPALAPPAVVVEPLILNVVSGSIKCNGGTTSVNLTASGGKSPYSFEGDTAQVRAGQHTYTVVDASGVRTTKTITISEPDRLDLTATSTPITKIGGTTTVTLSANGGVSPYQYTGTTTYVKAGKYTYSVADANGCTSSEVLDVREPSVTLSSYDVLRTDSSVAIQWSTNYEYAIDHFEIERTTDNTNYYLVSKVASLWSSLRLAKYVVNDTRPASKKNSYRISAVTTYGEKVVLQQKDLFYVDRGKISIRNMATALDVTVENPYNEELTLVLYDLSGKTLGTKTFQKQSFYWNTKWDMQSLRPGAYVLSILSQHVKYAKQVMKL